MYITQSVKNKTKIQKFPSILKTYNVNLTLDPT